MFLSNMSIAVCAALIICIYCVYLFLIENMASLAAKYDYLENLTRKVCVSKNQEPKKRPYGKILDYFNLKIIWIDFTIVHETHEARVPLLFTQAKCCVCHLDCIFLFNMETQEKSLQLYEFPF